MLTTPNAGKTVEQQEVSFTAGGATNGSSHFGRRFGGCLEKLKALLPHYPTILLPSIYSNELKTYVYTNICVYSSFLHNG